MTQRLRETAFREYSEIKKIVDVYQRYRAANEEAEASRSLLAECNSDPDLATLAEQDIRDKSSQARVALDELEALLRPADPDAARNAIVEITAGVGGDEACLFAGELLRMYGRFAKSKGWELEEIDISEGKVGGIKAITLQVIGHGAYGHLRYESGIHRVQRFSATAATDIMHTSAATVVVLPEIKPVDCIIKESEVREDNFATGGPGGQNQNKSCSGVRLTHLPTGIVASIREGKSQLQNRKRAWQVLSARVSDHFAQQVERSADATRRKLRGRGSRCEKIRTYNFPQDRITDHRVDLTLHGLDKILGGELDPLVQKLTDIDLNDRS